MPYLNPAGKREPGKDERQGHRQYLSDDNDAVTAIPISNNSANGCEQKNRKLAGKTDEAKQYGRVRELVHKPRLGNVLHPSARQRDELASEIQLIISMAQCPEHRR